MENKIDEKLRNRILDDLSQHFSRDTLSMDEYEQRVQAVYKAQDNLELVKVNEDILPSKNYLQPTVKDNRGVSSGSHPEHLQSIAIFSGASLQGDFDAPERLETVSIFGGCQIDLRYASIPPGGMDIETTAIFGGIEIILPQDCDFQVRVTAIFGGVNHPSIKRSTGRPMIRIHGEAIFGGVDIKQP